MNVAITGGTGFIGRKLVQRHLERGDHVRVLSRRPLVETELPHSIEWFEGDLVVFDHIVSFVDGVDVLYHCAGQLTDESGMRSLHVGGTRVLVKGASRRIGHWVQLSSVGVYGPISIGLITEQSPLNPVGEYEVTKAESDELVIDAAREGAFSYSVLRPSNVYGEEMTNQSLFHLIAMIGRGLFFFVGRKGASANYIHVDNVVEGLIRCGTIKGAKNKTFNLSDHCSMERFVGIICSELGCKYPKLRFPEFMLRVMAGILGKLPGCPLTLSRVDALTRRSVYSIKSIQEKLDYQLVVSMEDGLRRLVSEYMKRRDNG
ncbi:MAG: NAD(P)-dependent oxidoreductase [Deltaproteobacteria bacterium]|nr:NAD(P)-dependent oxidoreductase [Deltaproteobacteria bacterium]